MTVTGIIAVMIVDLAIIAAAIAAAGFWLAVLMGAN